VAQRLLNFAQLHLGFQIIALVEQLFARTQRDLDLHQRVLEIHAQRNQRTAAGGERLGDLAKLVAVQQQLSDPLGVMVIDVAERILLDVRIVQP
jgi:hypothetical protein